MYFWLESFPKQINEYAMNWISQIQIIWVQYFIYFKKFMIHVECIVDACIPKQAFEYRLWAGGQTVVQARSEEVHK